MPQRAEIGQESTGSNDHERSGAEPGAGEPGATMGKGVADPWQWVSEQVVAGIGHDLSDRLSTLFGLIQLAELDGSIGSDLSGPLRSELERAEALIELLRLIPAPREERAEPIRVADLVPTLQAIIRRHRGLEGVRLLVEGAADPVVHMGWNQLLRELLVLISRVGSGGVIGGGDSAEGVGALGVGTLEVVLLLESDGDSGLIEVRAGEVAARGAWPLYGM